MITNNARTEIRNWLAGSSATAPVSLAVGTGTSSATVADTGLFAEITRGTIAATAGTYLVEYEKVLNTLEATGSTISEFGLFNSASATSGTLYLRNIFAGIQKTDAIEVQFNSRVSVEANTL